MNLPAMADEATHEAICESLLSCVSAMLAVDPDHPADAISAMPDPAVELDSVAMAALLLGARLTANVMGWCGPLLAEVAGVGGSDDKTATQIAWKVFAAAQALAKQEAGR